MNNHQPDQQLVHIILIPTNPQRPKIIKWKVILPSNDQYEIKISISKHQRILYVNECSIFTTNNLKMQSYSFTLQNQIMTLLALDQNKDPTKQQYNLIHEASNNVNQNNILAPSVAISAQQSQLKNSMLQSKIQIKEYFKKINFFIQDAQNFFKLVHQFGLHNKEVAGKYKQLSYHLENIPKLQKKIADIIQRDVDSEDIDINQALDVTQTLDELKEKYAVLKVQIQEEIKEQRKGQEQQQNIDKKGGEEEEEKKENQDILKKPQSPTMAKKQKQDQVKQQPDNVDQDDIILDLSLNSDQENENQKEEPEEIKQDEEQEEKQPENAQEPCIICMDQPVTHVCIPCGHFKYCGDCAQLIINKECAFCRQPAQQLIKIFT